LHGLTAPASTLKQPISTACAAFHMKPGILKFVAAPCPYRVCSRYGIGQITKELNYEWHGGVAAVLAHFRTHTARTRHDLLSQHPRSSVFLARHREEPWSR